MSDRNVSFTSSLSENKELHTGYGPVGLAHVLLREDEADQADSAVHQAHQEARRGKHLVARRRRRHVAQEHLQEQSCAHNTPRSSNLAVENRVVVVVGLCRVAVRRIGLACHELALLGHDERCGGVSRCHVFHVMSSGYVFM